MPCEGERWGLHTLRLVSMRSTRGAQLARMYGSADTMFDRARGPSESH
jgi:hypothetical protein